MFNRQVSLNLAIKWKVRASGGKRDNLEYNVISRGTNLSRLGMGSRSSKQDQQGVATSTSDRQIFGWMPEIMGRKRGCYCWCQHHLRRTWISGGQRIGLCMTLSLYLSRIRRLELDRWHRETLVVLWFATWNGGTEKRVSCLALLKGWLKSFSPRFRYHVVMSRHRQSMDGPSQQFLVEWITSSTGFMTSWDWPVTKWRRPSTFNARGRISASGMGQLLLHVST